jgi:Ca2+-binding RTX toxin-like protein
LTGGGTGADAGAEASATAGGSIFRTGASRLVTADRDAFPAGAWLARLFGAGSDAAFFGAGSDAAFFGAGSDVAFFGAGSDVAFFGADSDAAFFGAGSDVAFFGAGSEVARRGASGIDGSKAIAVAVCSLVAALRASLESDDCRHCHSKPVPAAPRISTLKT